VKTYGRTYNFQQQDDCKERGHVSLIVPSEANDYENETVPEVVNDPEMGVSFAAWLARDPKQPLKNQENDWELNMWWDRNFYPDVQMIANDLHAKGLLDAGEYSIDIDWLRFAGQLHVHGIDCVTTKTFKILPSDDYTSPSNSDQTAKIKELEFKNKRLLADIVTLELQQKTDRETIASFVNEKTSWEKNQQFWEDAKSKTDIREQFIQETLDAYIKEV
jgi:hypothetical protein